MHARQLYEPSKGHGLKHDPLNSIVAPRPIGRLRDHRSHPDIRNRGKNISIRPIMLALALGILSSSAFAQTSAKTRWQALGG